MESGLETLFSPLFEKLLQGNLAAVSLIVTLLPVTVSVHLFPSG